MPTIEQCIRRLLPQGSNPNEDNVAHVPLWPPDLFAVTATLARLSECYTLAAVRGGMGFATNHGDACAQIGRNWSGFEPSVEPWLQERWDVLLQHGAESVVALRDYNSFGPLIRAVFELMAAADEAAVGVGFGGDSEVADLARFFVYSNGSATLCNRVAEEEACVQPKGRTPSVGCNLRSMSHHLALVPPSTQVTTTHLEAQEPFGLTGDANLGVLLVPFPYRVRDDDFLELPPQPGQSWARLNVACSWHFIPPQELAQYVRDLIEAAAQDGRATDVVVFPELALTTEMWDALITVNGPRFFVGGVLKPQIDDQPPLNLARAHFVETSPVRWEQAKHHRWRIEKYQVANYGLALRPPNFTNTPSLLEDPSWVDWYGWWEDIDIKGRGVVTARFHRGATVSTLVCEDLARVDPVQPVLRELGPTWLIALLMDGPQYKHRWAAQGAGVFADDPGSSVLVLSSLALIQRNRDNREKRRGSSHAVIGLWRDPGGALEELELPASAHALHLNLYSKTQREVTLDGRADDGQAIVLKLRRCSAVAVQQPPAWVQPFRPS